MKKNLSIEERFELIKQNTAEIVSEDALKQILQKKKKPVVYCGYELNGPMHLGHFVTIIKLMDFLKAGFNAKVLLADVHTFLNRKGSEEEIAKEVQNWRKTLKAIGLKCDVVLGSGFQFKKEYQLDVMRLAQESTIQRGLRSMQEIARDAEHATISQLWYPLMQVVDIKYLGADVAEGGLEQRKVHMIGKDFEKELQHSFVAVHTPLITSLKGPRSKMSKSISGSGIAVTDNFEVIKKTLQNAYCPAKIIEDNPILQITRLILFPQFLQLVVQRPEKFGGKISYDSYEQLEKDFADGKLHPLDLKNMVGECLEKVIAPIRKRWK